MNFAEQLNVLQAAQGNPAKLVLATIDLKYPGLSETEREVLKQALEAAAIPHWCDEGILAALLGISSEDSAARLARLRGLTVVEPFLARGETAVNVHESARLALRKAMAGDSPERFGALSREAAALFQDDLTIVKKIEHIYHLLCADPERGAEKLEQLSGEWTESAHPEDLYALACALSGLEQTNVVHGAARVEVLLCIAETRDSRGEASQLEKPALEVLALSHSVKRPSGEARANGLLGDALNAQGKLIEAEAAFREGLAISRRLVAHDPSNMVWQRNLAVAHKRVGGVLEAQGKLGEAEAAFREGLAISRRLVAHDPSNMVWQRNLAVAHKRVGGVLEAQGKLGEAEAAFREHLAISLRLVAHDPSNLRWLDDLAVAHNRVGGLLEAQGKLGEAEAAFREGLAISLRLVAHDPSNLRWLDDLAVAHNRVGGLLEAQGKLGEAKAAFREYLAISRRLVAHDPSNLRWLDDLAVAHNRVGGVLEAQGKLGEAEAAFREYLAISRRLVAHDPSNLGWQRCLAVACMRSARLEVKAGHHATALPLYEEASRTLAELTRKAPAFVQWIKDKEQVEAELAQLRLEVHKPKLPGPAIAEDGSASDNQ